MARRGSTDRGIWERRRKCTACIGAAGGCPTCKHDPHGQVGTGVWWIEYYDGDGRRHRERVGTKSQARQAYAFRKTEVREKRFKIERVGRAKPKILLSDAIDRFLEVEAPHLRGRNVRWGMELWRRVFGSHPIDLLTSDDVLRWRTSRKKDGVQNSTINRDLTYLRQVLRFAREQGMTENDPFVNVRSLEPPQGRIRYLSEEEQDRLREACCQRNAWFWPWILIAIGTGLRLGEQLRLMWSDVDLNGKSIYIRRPKTRRGEKLESIPLRRDVEALFLSLPSRRAGERCFCWRDNPDHAPNNNLIHDLFSSTIRAAGVENLHWHDLRHTFASRLVMAGVDLYRVSKLMRHSSISMTERYAHLSPQHLRDAIDAFVL